MNDWPCAGWLFCEGQDAGNGTVCCTIRVVGAGTREIIVPADTFDAQRRLLKVRVVRPSESDGNFDCPSQETEALAFIVECPVIDAETRRFDILAGFLSERTEEPEQAGKKV